MLEIGRLKAERKSLGGLVRFQQADTLRLLRALLLILILAATIGSVAGGLLLANRAIEPARAAFARQQTFIADAASQIRGVDNSGGRIVEFQEIGVLGPSWRALKTVHDRKIG